MKIPTRSPSAPRRWCAEIFTNVGTRVMRQSTLAMLSHGYAISITVIGGTDDEVEDLMDGLSFLPDRRCRRRLLDFDRHLRRMQ